MSSNKEQCKIAECLANDNFYGFPEADILKYRVRWIELVAASPVLTCLIAYYIEGDHGHVLDERVFQRTNTLNIRGNAYSFQTPWESIISKLKCVLADVNSWNVLPHDENTLAIMVLFNLRVGNVTDLQKWLPTAKLQPHVVLKLMCNLIDRKYTLCCGSRVAQQIKAQVKNQLEAKFPEPADQGDLL